MTIISLVNSRVLLLSTIVTFPVRAVLQMMRVVPFYRESTWCVMHCFLMHVEAE
jgi:hypothetical protein